VNSIHPRHLLSVWNPSYAQSAMDEHLALLLELAGQYEDEKIELKDVYVWWGKVRSPNRQQPLAHAHDVHALGRALIADGATEKHLYVTDYLSMYVAHPLAIHDEPLPPLEEKHVPGYYRKEGLNCDFWFKLGDIRRLVTGDMLGVIGELKQLRNIHYAERPVSLYGGMVDLPLVVIRPDGRRFFDDAEREQITEDMLWVEWDAEKVVGTSSIERELRDNLIGDHAWTRLELSVRTFLALAERDFRDHRADAGYDFAGMIVNLGKALEVQCNAVLRQALAKVPAKHRMAKMQDRTVDLFEHHPLMLGELARALAGEATLVAALGGALTNAPWFTGQLPSILDAFSSVRNPAAHQARVGRDIATHWRNRLLGVGCKGDMIELAACRLK
jgi:hypothetical protein